MIFKSSEDEHPISTFPLNDQTKMEIPSEKKKMIIELSNEDSSIRFIAPSEKEKMAWITAISVFIV